MTSSAQDMSLRVKVLATLRVHSLLARAILKPENLHLSGRIQQLLSSQLVGVMATSQCGQPASVSPLQQPYTSLMAFAHTADLRFLIVATMKETQKHANLLQNASLSMLIDNRGNCEEDYQEAVAISVIGRAETVPSAEHARMQALFLLKHPKLQSFLALPDCALLRIVVQSYRVVAEFQCTQVLIMAQ